MFFKAYSLIITIVFVGVLYLQLFPPDDQGDCINSCIGEPSAKIRLFNSRRVRGGKEGRLRSKQESLNELSMIGEGNQNSSNMLVSSWESDSRIPETIRADVKQEIERIDALVKLDDQKKNRLALFFLAEEGVSSYQDEQLLQEKIPETLDDILGEDGARAYSQLLEAEEKQALEESQNKEIAYFVEVLGLSVEGEQRLKDALLNPDRFELMEAAYWRRVLGLSDEQVKSFVALLKGGSQVVESDDDNLEDEQFELVQEEGDFFVSKNELEKILTPEQLDRFLRIESER